MAGDDVALRLMFVNHDLPPDKTELGVKLTTSVSDVKKRILTERWPEGYTPVEDVQRIRVFVGGREMVDSSLLRDYKTALQPSNPTPVHVVCVQKASANEEHIAKKEQQAQSQCGCVLL